MRTIDLNKWLKVGEGGNGTVYECPAEPGTVLKVNSDRINTLPKIEHEYNVSKNVKEMGLPTPGMQEIVEVGDNHYGIIQERIRSKKSLSRICHDNPSRIEEMARVLCEEGRKLFGTPCPTDRFPSRKEQLLGVIDEARFLTRKEREMVRGFAYSIPECDYCIHGDFHSGNLVSSEGKYYWIDLDRFAHGDPMFDIGHLFQICQVYSSMKQVQEIFHMSQAQLKRLWEAFAQEYTGQEDHAAFDRLAGKFACLDVIVRNYFMPATFLEKLFFSVIVRKLVKAYYDAE